MLLFEFWVMGCAFSQMFKLLNFVYLLGLGSFHSNKPSSYRHSIPTTFGQDFFPLFAFRLADSGVLQITNQFCFRVWLVLGRKCASRSQGLLEAIRAPKLWLLAGVQCRMLGRALAQSSFHPGESSPCAHGMESNLPFHCCSCFWTLARALLWFKWEKAGLWAVLVDRKGVTSLWCWCKKSVLGAALGQELGGNHLWQVTGNLWNGSFTF